MQYSLKALLALASHAITFADAGSVLFTDATIITFNANSSKTNVLHGSSLLVEGDRIQQIFDGITPNSYPNGTEVVNATGKIIRVRRPRYKLRNISFCGCV